MRRGEFELTLDKAFEEVVRACADLRERGTWILPEIIDAYTELWRLGHAHSFEVWMDGELAGGLYGVQRGGLFAAESMFHRRTDASKVALVAATFTLSLHGVDLIDVQFSTSHLRSLGARTISRDAYLRRLRTACATGLDIGAADPWKGIHLALTKQ